MKRLLALVLPVLWAGSLSAQQMRLTAERQQNNNVDIMLENKTYPGTLTVFLNLRDITNCNQTTGYNRYEIKVTRDKERVTMLRPIDPTRGIGYGYSYRFFRGRVNSRVDTMFVYRMPCSSLKKDVSVNQTYNIREIQKERKQRERLGLHFNLEKGDTIYAMRRGVVVHVEVAEQPGDGAVSYSTRNTRLVVEHPDGSMATYSCLDPDLLVELGEHVLPTTPLALAGTFDGQRYGINVTLFRYTADTGSGGDEPDKLVQTEYLLQWMATTEGDVRIRPGTYTPNVTSELLTGEMTKKEQKKFGVVKK